VVVAACAIMFVHVFIPGPGDWTDFTAFYTGAYADVHGLSPFIHSQLWQAEQVLLFGGGYHGPEQVIFYGNPPPFALLLRPLTGLSIATAYWTWCGLMVAATSAGAWLFLGRWPAPARGLGTFAVACCGAALWGYRVGQVAPMLVLALGVAVWCLQRNRPWLSGFALTFGFMQPHVLIGIAVVLLLTAGPESRRRMVAGFATGIAGWAGIAVAFDGGLGAIRDWVGSLGGDPTLLATQADVAALPGLLLHAVPTSYDNLIVVASLACAALSVAYFASRERGTDSPLLMCGGIAGCYSLLPYVHTSDQVVLVLLVLLLIGPDGAGLLERPVLLAAWVCCLAPLAMFHDYRTPVFDVLPPVSVLVACGLLGRGSRTRLRQA